MKEDRKIIKKISILILFGLLILGIRKVIISVKRKIVSLRIRPEIKKFFKDFSMAIKEEFSLNKRKIRPEIKKFYKDFSRMIKKTKT